MKRKIVINKKLSLKMEKLSQLNEEQLSHFIGGRMAAATLYTGTAGQCSVPSSSCCSLNSSSCCG